MPKLFITGICGFIGSNVAAEALKQGYTVSGADIKDRKIPGAKVAKADIRDKDAMVRLTKGVDYIVHLAAVTSNLEFEKRMPYCFDVNVNGFNSVIEAACINGCRRFVYASSSAVYSDQFSETVKIEIGKMTNHYAKTKLINEAVAQSYRSRKLVDAVGLRYFNVYGPGENAKGNYASIVNLFTRYKKAHRPIEIYGDGKQARDLIYVTDAAKITLALLRKAKEGVYNVGTGKSTSYNDIADMIDREGEKRHVRNPLSSYQKLTKANTTRLQSAIGRFNFVQVAKKTA